MKPPSALPAAAVALSLLLSACGNKGPLILPDAAPVETAPTAPGDVPVTVEPPVTLPQPEAGDAPRDPTSADPLPVEPVTDPPPAGTDPAGTDQATDEGTDPNSDGEADDAPDEDGGDPPAPGARP